LIIFPHIWELVRELVEVDNKLVQNLLFAVKPPQERQELNLDGMEVLLDLLSLESLFAEHFLHL